MNATLYLPFVGRLLIGLPFTMSGLSKFAAYGPTTEMIGAAGLPAPSLAFAVAVVVELGSGLLLVAGFQARIVAIVLTLFCLATAVSFHSNFADQNQMIHFLKNIMIAGGLLRSRASARAQSALTIAVPKPAMLSQAWWRPAKSARCAARSRYVIEVRIISAAVRYAPRLAVMSATQMPICESCAPQREHSKACHYEDRLQRQDS
jgi:putative oxidoreductase